MVVSKSLRNYFILTAKKTRVEITKQSSVGEVFKFEFNL